MKFLKPKFWENRANILAIMLIPFSILFYFLINLKKYFISPKKFNIPVICVGNIYVGGTGKTPLSIEIANDLKLKKRNPVIIPFTEQNLLFDRTHSFFSFSFSINS